MTTREEQNIRKSNNNNKINYNDKNELTAAQFSKLVARFENEA